MRILIIGGGGREHALAWALARSPQRPELFVAPGNPGTAALGRNVPIAATDLPVLIGSGLTADNFADYVDLADGFIIGSAFKENGDWRAPVCEHRARALVGAAEFARGQEAVTLR